MDVDGYYAAVAAGALDVVLDVRTTYEFVGEGPECADSWDPMLCGPGQRF